MSTSRLERQLAFVIEADQLKGVLRKNLVLGQARPENSGEHSWHLALAAIVLAEHSTDPDIDLSRVLRMLLVHDLVEIDAGDTYLYDDAGRATKAARERAAADRIFGLLPSEQADSLRGCWDEFEARETPEARFAAAVDRLMPMLLNFIAKGVVWKENGVTRSQIVEHCSHMVEGSPALWAYAEALLDDAVARGYLPPEPE